MPVLDTYVPRYYQREARDSALFGWMEFNRQLLHLGTGGGKCLGRGTPVLMFDGSTKPVEDIKVGDLLIGPDSLPRKVVATTSGRENLYRVHQKKGDSYVINESHILSLKMTNIGGRMIKCGPGHYTTGEIANVSVSEYLATSAKFRHCAKGWKSPISWRKQKVHPDLPPYILGVWLGDGLSNGSSISVPEPELHTAWRNHAEILGVEFRLLLPSGGRCPVAIASNGRGKANRFFNALREIEVLNNKHIPKNYLVNTPENQLELLAGLLDTDGHYDGKEYDFISIHRHISEGVVFLARSLGFKASIREKTNHCQTGASGQYWRVQISGDIERIPCRIPKKQASQRRQIKDHLLCGVSLELIGPGEYFGFELSGPDKLFLLGDFTVTHNTSIMADMIGRLAPQERCLLLADQDELCEQPRRTIRRITGSIAALEKGTDRAPLEARVVVGSSQTLARTKRRERFPRDHFDKIMIDEAHRGTERDLEICDHFETAQVLGVTATPFKANLRDLSRWYESTCFSMPLIDQTGEGLDLIGEGFAPPLEWCVLPEEFDLSGVKTRQTADGKEFDERAVDDLITPKFKTIAEYLGDTAKGRHIIVALPLISSSEKFAEVCRQMGLRARHVDGKSTDRDLILEGFNQGHFDILCNSNVLSTGVDLPIADYFLPLKPMRSAALYQQFLGRVFRVLPGIIDHLPEQEQAELRRQLIRQSAKPKATVCDPLFLHDELGVMHAGRMFAASEEDARGLFEKAKKLRTPAEAEALARHFQKEKEKKLKEALEKAALRARSRMVDADFIGALLDSATLLHYEPVQKWEMAAPTDRQKELLANLGVNVETVKTKGLASKILDVLNSRFREGLATLKQVKVLKQFHQEDAHLLTFKGASERMDSIFQQRRLEKEAVHG